MSIVKSAPAKNQGHIKTELGVVEIIVLYESDATPIADGEEATSAPFDKIVPDEPTPGLYTEFCKLYDEYFIFS